MELPKWLWRFKHKKPTPAGKLCCDNCERAIQKHDRFIITGARHRDCDDRRLTGQMSLPKGEVSE